MSDHNTDDNSGRFEKTLTIENFGTEPVRLLSVRAEN